MHRFCCFLYESRRVISTYRIEKQSLQVYICGSIEISAYARGVFQLVLPVDLQFTTETSVSESDLHLIDFFFHLVYGHFFIHSQQKLCMKYNLVHFSSKPSKIVIYTFLFVLCVLVLIFRYKNYDNNN